MKANWSLRLNAASVVLNVVFAAVSLMVLGYALPAVWLVVALNTWAVWDEIR